ncbi:DNA cytosine methyltransferase [Sporolactobacillus sp. THM19-2]|uniref:DNA cytosine methyltransferase n=1 Tax=Sporolactobacillus sp. THM19-2 TaxID=2511171 RepID=UPI00101EF765|nr:DNA cytosine methyltransferase [Sporolactobacillus sp. THM19-2]RYL92470.1 DNA cytosine methyltransferase [Sporolactobacillus sp. THM19-2]
MKQKEAIKTVAALNSLQVVDLFSGCGGLSYGFHLEGLKISAGLEINEQAAYTASYNLYWKNGLNKEHMCRDINTVDASEFQLNTSSPLITIGGPPCQAYSRIGKSKIRSLGEDRFGLNDKRAFLYKQFLRIALNLDSQAVVMENVPESVNFFGINIPETVCEILEKNGYNPVWTILNAADFGVPQTRERVFVMAVKKNAGTISFMPEPTHVSPEGNDPGKIYCKYRKMTEYKHFRLPSVASEGSPGWVTVKDAISDLPALFPEAGSKYVLHNMTTKMPYQTPPVNDYQRQMRSLPGNQYSNEVDGNCFRKTVRDFRIFEKMKAGQDYRDAYRIANELFNRECQYRNININDRETYEKLKKEFVPPYDLTKFHGKWKKLSSNKPSHTLVAHLGTDTYSHIHPWEPRGISVREAARLQSFPDDFTFNVSMSSAFKQIGNAVPPFLSRGVAKAIIKNLLQGQK